MFQINRLDFRKPDRMVRGTIENITSEAARGKTASGALTKLTTPNVASTWRLQWSCLDGYEMKRLCALFGIDQPNWFDNNGKPQLRSERDRIVPFKTIFPVGIREIEVYVGDTFTFTLDNKAGFDEIVDFTSDDYLDFIVWRDVQIDIVGIGQVETNLQVTTWRR